MVSPDLMVRTGVSALFHLRWAWVWLMWKGCMIGWTWGDVVELGLLAVRDSRGYNGHYEFVMWFLQVDEHI